MVGVSGSGKTTFAARLAHVLAVPHLELDAVFWDAGWTKRDLVDARGLLEAFLAQSPDGWVTDGNWSAGTEGLLTDADAVVWLDFPRRVVMPRVVRRTVWRGLRRTELWHGNREDLRTLLRRDPEQNVVRWSWTSHRPVRLRYEAMQQEATTRVIRLRTPRAARHWLATVATPPR